MERKVGLYTVKLGNDECKISPRHDDNLGVMICFHKRYTLGDKHDYKVDNYNGWDEMKSDIIKNENVCVILPLYLYDHSGITMNTTGFSCPWDSGRVGFVYVSKENVRKEYNVKHITKKIRDKVTKVLIGEVETYDKYLTGEVYCFEILDEDKNIIESCGGYYDMDKCLKEALSFVPEY